MGAVVNRLGSGIRRWPPAGPWDPVLVVIVGDLQGLPRDAEGLDRLRDALQRERADGLESMAAAAAGQRSDEPAGEDAFRFGDGFEARRLDDRDAVDVVRR